MIKASESIGFEAVECGIIAKMFGVECVSVRELRFDASSKIDASLPETENFNLVLNTVSPYVKPFDYIFEVNNLHNILHIINSIDPSFQF